MRLHYWQEDAGECRQAAAGKATGARLRGAPWSGDGGGGRARLPLDWVPAGGGETAGRARERGSGGRVAVQEGRGEEHRSGQELREPQSRGRVRAPAALLPVQLCAPFPQVRILPCTLVSATPRPPSRTRVNAHSFSPFVHSMEVQLETFFSVSTECM